MIIQRSSLKYIAYQRTDYLELQRNLLLRLATCFFTRKNKHRIRIGFECLLRRSTIIAAYEKDLLAEYNEIKNYLPLKVKNILDIGCGIGGIDVFLNHHFMSQEPHFYCLDKTKIDTIYYGFKNSAAFYNSLENTRKFLQLNGIQYINILNANSHYTIPTNEKFELIISLIAWGYHFPVDTYLDEVYSHLNKDGHLIMDVRKDTNGIEIIDKKFSKIISINESEKKIRVLAVK